MLEKSKLYLGDCLIKSNEIKNGSVDLILTDLPYGIAKTLGRGIERYKNSSDSKWDEVIEPKKIYEIANRILRKNGKMILFAQQPFTTQLISKTIPNLSHLYNMYWDKLHFANCLSANKAPVSYIEDILVFGKKNEKEDFKNSNTVREWFCDEFNKSKFKTSDINKMLGNSMASHYFTKGVQFRFPTFENFKILQETGFFTKDYVLLQKENEKCRKELLEDLNTKYPSTFNLWEGKKFKSNILNYKKEYDGFHPTQKPILLLEDLIKTFSNEGNKVVDLTMGSGSTGVACNNTNRIFLGIEKDENYYNIAVKRINR